MFPVIQATFQSGIGIGQDLFLDGMLHAVPYLARWRWLTQHVISSFRVRAMFRKNIHGRFEIVLWTCTYP